MTGQTEQIKKRINWGLFGLAVLLCLIKYGLIVSLPVEARGYNTDDLLMLRMARGFLYGEWLGNYDAVILMKGSFFPIFLALTRIIGPSYLGVLTAINISACSFFVFQMRNLVRNKRLLYVLFIVLLFDPCSFAQMTFQRVYRTSVMEMLVLFLFGSYFGLYLLVRQRRHSGDWSGLWREGALGLVGGFALWAIWNAREESMWVLPFVITGTILIVVELIGAIQEQKALHFSICTRFLCCILPVLLLLGGNEWIRWENRRHYGASIRLEEVDGEFGRALKTIYSVKNKVEVPYATVSREKMERLYAASESLRRIRPELEKQLARYDNSDRGYRDGQVEDGWFFWALKYAAFENGAAKTLPDSQAFWKQVRIELEEAINKPENELERQAVMPSALMSPWRGEYLAELPSVFWKAICYVISFEETEPAIRASGKAQGSVCRFFEIFTNNMVVYPDQENELQNQILESVSSRLTFILRIYRTLNPVAALLGTGAFFALMFYSIKKKAKEHVPFILIVAGMVLSSAVILCGTAYTHISAFYALRYPYMAGAYALTLASEWLGILYIVDRFLQKHSINR